MENYQITADLKRVNGDDSYTIALPLPSKTLRDILIYRGYKCTKEFTISETDCRGDDNFTHALNEVFDNMEAPKKLEELNYLAFKISEMSEEERDVFGAVLSTEKHQNSLAEMINLTENLDGYQLQPAHNEYQLGDFLIDVYSDITSEAFNRLENSNDSTDLDLVTYIERLEESVDKERFGRNIAETEGGDFTPFGYLTSHSFMREKYQGISDMPLEYRLTKPTLIEKIKIGKQKSNELYSRAEPTKKNRGDITHE